MLNILPKSLQARKKPPPPVWHTACVCVCVYHCVCTSVCHYMCDCVCVTVCLCHCWCMSISFLFKTTSLAVHFRSAEEKGDTQSQSPLTGTAEEKGESGGYQTSIFLLARQVPYHQTKVADGAARVRHKSPYIAACLVHTGHSVSHSSEHDRISLLCVCS